MEDLTKQQLILLALLVSFVTSLATGIVTVTLVEQAPQDVVRTIDRVIEKTVETIVPGETKIVEKVKEVKIGATDSEKIAKVAKKRADTMVLIGHTQTGILVSAEGHLLTTSFPDTSEPIDILWTGAPDGALEMTALIEESSAGGELVLLKIEVDEGEGEDEPSTISSFFGFDDVSEFPYVEIENPNVSLGELVVALSVTGGGGHSISTGMISSYKAATASSSTAISVNIASDGIDGSPVYDLAGDTIGMLSPEGLILSVDIIDFLKQADILSAAPADDSANTASVVDSI